MMATDERPCLTERLAVARNTKDMTTFGGMIPAGHKNAAADVLLAAGMVGQRSYAIRLGVALASLMAAWDTCAKPPKRTDAEIAARALAFKAKGGKPDYKRARAEAIVWHARELRELATKLRGRAEVIALLTGWAEEHGIDVDLLSPALFHWISPRCPVCSGHGKMKREDAPVLGMTCNHCRGEGTWPKPPSAHRIHDYMQMCLRLAGQEELRVLR